MQTRRYILISFLLFSWILPFCIISMKYQGDLQLARESARHQLKDKHANHDRIWLSFSLKEAETQLRWKHDREFEYKEEMYDIISSKIDGDSVRYFCYVDRHETSLNNEFRALVVSLFSPGQQNPEQRQYTRDFIKSIYLVRVQVDPAIELNIASADSYIYSPMWSDYSLVPGLPPPEGV